jgi:putative hydrolase of the HAD superfamily
LEFIWNTRTPVSVAAAVGRPIRAVLLDAHGTLLELEPPALALRTLMEERFGVRITPEQADAAIAAEIRYYRAHLHEGRDEQSVDELRGRCSEVLRQALAAEHVLHEIRADEFTETLLAALQFRPYPEVPAVLRELRARGLRLVVASNWDASLPHTLDRIGLLGALDGVVTSAECSAPKPEPPVFRRALELAGVPSGEALHVGDSPDEDLAGARRSGIEAVLIARDGHPAVPGERSISSLRELLALPELLPRA